MQPHLVIVGAGVAGLIAARHCEEAGLTPLIVDQNNRPGGRVLSDTFQGFTLDHGFQVLLTAYDEARRYLDFEALQLRSFSPGALIFSAGKRFEIGDPLRDAGALFPTLLSPAGSLKDKYLIWKLSQELKGISRETIFAEPGNISTLDFLKRYGFSGKIIHQFFKPFFGGIFLENDLRTSARMFRFVFKMFSEGEAAIPAAGMGAIADQLAQSLKSTTFQWNARVRTIEGKRLILESGEQVPYDKLILATDPFSMLPALASQEVDYVATRNLYFKASASPLGKPAIALVADEANPINNFCVLTDVAPGYAQRGKTLLSVTVKDRFAQAELSDEALSLQVIEALTGLPGMGGIQPVFLKAYWIKRALPVIEELRYSAPASQAQLTEDIYLAGDYLLNASLDAAMRSGRLAAEALLSKW